MLAVMHAERVFDGLRLLNCTHLFVDKEPPSFQLDYLVGYGGWSGTQAGIEKAGLNLAEPNQRHHPIIRKTHPAHIPPGPVHGQATQPQEGTGTARLSS